MLSQARGQLPPWRPPGHPVNLGSRQQKSADPIDITPAGTETCRRGADLLDRAQAPIGIDVRQQALPRFGNHGLIGPPVEQTLVDAPREAECEERRSGNLGVLVSAWVEQAASPQTVFALSGGNRLRHL